MDSISVGETKDCNLIRGQTLSGFFEKFLDSNPEKLNHIAVKDADREDTRITFDELNKRSNRLARSLVNTLKNRKLGE